MSAPVKQEASSLAEEVGLDVRPMAGHVGAEIFGVDVSKPLEPEVVAAIRDVWLRWKFIGFRDQDLSPGRQVAFARLFGDPTPAHPLAPPDFPEHPEILVLDYEIYKNKEIAQPAALPPAAEEVWHGDVTYAPRPPLGSILYGVAVPPYGGDTQFANLAVAYQTLAEPLQRLVEGLHAVHRDIPVADGSKPIASAVHPVVAVHPETGEKILWVNPSFTSHIVELSREENERFLPMLFDHVTRESFTCRFRWQPGSVAFWDNRAVNHLIPTDLPSGFTRTMHRVTLKGDIPTGPDGFAGYALTGQVAKEFT